MFETMAQFVLADHMGGAAFAPPQGEMGYKRLLSPTRGPYPTKEGYLALMVYSNHHWAAFSRAIGQPDLLTADPRFATQEARTQHAAEIGAFLAEILATRTTAEWLEALHKADVPAG